MASRVKRIVHDENTRSKIQAAHIIRRLHQHVMGEVDMSASQVTAAKTLLGKVLPDLQAIDATVDFEGEMNVRSVRVEGVSPKDA